MGAWGVGPFDNDDAADWLAEFSEDPSLESVRIALEAVTDLGDSDYLEITECGAAIAAAEIVAVHGRASIDLPEEVVAWVDEHEDNAAMELSELALCALARVKTDSEMESSWKDGAMRQEWIASVEELEGRVSR